MSGRLFRVPVAYPNFARTVVESIEPSEFSPPPDLPRDIAEAGGVRIWGTRKGGGNREQYEVMASGDGLLFYDDGTCRYAGQVGEKFQTPWVSRTFWGYAPAELLYTVEGFVEVQGGDERLASELGGAAHGDPEGIDPVPDDAVERIQGRYGSVSAFVEALGRE